jgi:hypothetical protein
MGAAAMKGTPRSLWLSAANRVTGWWMGHAANIVRQAQRAMAKQTQRAVTKAAQPGATKAARPTAKKATRAMKRRR